MASHHKRNVQMLQPRALTNHQRRTKLRCRRGTPVLFVCFIFAFYGWMLWTHHQQVINVGKVVTNNGGENQRQVDSIGNSVFHTVPIGIDGDVDHDHVVANISHGIRVSSASPQGSLLKGDERKFAYAFLLGGAMSDKPGSDHRGGLYSVVVAAYNLRRHNSTADVVLMVQMSARSNATRLPEQQAEVLRRMDIDVMYLPKYADPKFEKFYNLMLEKFRILSLTQYDRVLYLDYDVMPLCNLDYLFELSYQGILKENVVLANSLEPSSGGFFILAPNATDYQRLQNTIVAVENTTLYMGYPHWNASEGWGHAFEGGDYWVNLKGEKGFDWSWYGVQADQGLLYFWTKYMQQSVSIIIHHTVEHWGSKEGSIVKEGNDEGLLHRYSCTSGPRRKAAPYRDFVHLTGKKKPWHASLSLLEEGIRSKGIDRYSSEEQWLWLLKLALKSVGMDGEVSLDFIRGEVENAALGTTPGNRQRNMLIKNKAKVDWKQYTIEHNY